MSPNSPIYAIIANIMFILITWGIGYPLVNWLNKNRKDNFFPTGLVAPVVGMNMFALFFYLLSCSGIFKYVSPSSLAIPLLFYALIVIILSKRLELFKTKIIKLPYVLFSLLGLLLLGAALSPPLGWDEMVYHQPIVRRWIEDGFPNIYFDLPYSGFPSSNSFIFWFLSDTGGIIAPRLFIWSCWLLNSFILFRLLIKQGLGKVIASVLVITFCFTPVMVMVTADAYVEMIILINLTTALYLFSPVYDENACSETDSRLYYKLALLFAILAAGQASIKLTGIVLFAVPCALLLFHTPRELFYKKRIRICLFMAACWAVMAFPFYLRPLLITGNPFYPYFSGLFTDSNSTIAMSEFHHAIGSARYGSSGIPMFFVAPIALMFSQKTFEGYLGWQLAVMLVVFIWAIVIKREKRNQLFCLIIGLLYLFWFFTAQQARFITPALLILYYSAGLQMKYLKKIYLKIIGSALIILTLISLPFSSSGYYYFSWRQLLGKIKFDDYFYTGTGDYYLPAIDAMSNMTPKKAKVMLLFEHRLLYLPRACKIGTPYFQEEFFTPPDMMKKTDIAKILSDNSFNYILLSLQSEGPDSHKDYFEKSKNLILKIKEMIINKTLEPVWESDNHILLKINIPGTEGDKIGK